jgi:hypothetical protein
MRGHVSEHEFDVIVDLVHDRKSLDRRVQGFEAPSDVEREAQVDLCG